MVAVVLNKLAVLALVETVPPVTARLLLTVVVPVPAPKLTLVAAPPTFRVVAVVLNKLAVVEDVVIFPPFAARFAASVAEP